MNLSFEFTLDTTNAGGIADLLVEHGCETCDIVHILPKHLDEKIARQHLDCIGVKLNLRSLQR